MCARGCKQWLKSIRVHRLQFCEISIGQSERGELRSVGNSPTTEEARGVVGKRREPGEWKIPVLIATRYVVNYSSLAEQRARNERE